MIAEQTLSFLQSLFSTALPDHCVEIRHLNGGKKIRNDCSPIGKISIALEELAMGEWFFGTTLRNTSGVPIAGSLVWADLENEAADPYKDFKPEPSAVVSSGHGTHIYWRLEHPQSPEKVVNLSKLARLALNSDKQVCESRRIMRLPGSANRKGMSTIPCLLKYDSPITYSPKDLEEWLVAAIFAPQWVEGVRNALCLGLSAVLARAGWEKPRLLNTIRLICGMAGDTEDFSNRLKNAEATLQKHQNNETITAQAVRDCLSVEYDYFLEALGVTSTNGDLLYNGERVGNTTYIEKDLTTHFISLGEWSYAEGSLLQWNKTHWTLSTEKELLSVVFNYLRKFKMIQNGDERDYPPTIKVAKELTQFISGALISRPLAPASPYHFPLGNGVLDLQTLELLEHSRENRNRWVISTEYLPEAECPVWRSFIEFALEEDYQFLQEWFGYCLLLGNPKQYMLWLFGPTNTGKSTVLKTLYTLMEESATSFNINQINDYAVAALAKARVAVCAEMKSGTFETVKLKSMVSGDPIVARHPYGRPFSITFEGKFIFASNVMPSMDQTEGVWRRLIVLQMNKKPDNPDEMLLLKIKGEMPGVLNWALEGLKRLIARDFVWILPKNSREFVAEYESVGSPFRQFAYDELEMDPEGEIIAFELYTRYSVWAKERGLPSIPYGPTFYQEMRSIGLVYVEGSKRVEGKVTKVWRGARLIASSFS